MDCGI